MHLTLLTEQHDRIAQQIAGVQTHLQALEGKEELMAETMFEGFDHAEYRDEVEQRWGAKAAAASEAWWSGLSDANRHSWQAEVEALNADWRAAFEAGEKSSGTVGGRRLRNVMSRGSDRCRAPRCSRLGPRSHTSRASVNCTCVMSVSQQIMVVPRAQRSCEMLSLSTCGAVLHKRVVAPSPRPARTHTIEPQAARGRGVAGTE